MITTFLLTLLNSFIAFLLGLLPSGHLPASILSGIGYLWSLINAFTYVIPVQTLLAALLLMIAVDAALFLWRLINWIIRKIPFVN